jgi:hypothetical protein
MTQRSTSAKDFGVTKEGGNPEHDKLTKGTPFESETH